MEHKLRITRQHALEQVGKMVLYGRMRCDEVEFSAEDASRSDLDYLLDVIEAAASAGATIINLPDTVGYSTPEEYGAMFQAARKTACGLPKCNF